MLTRLRAKALNVILSDKTPELKSKKPTQKQQLKWLRDNHTAVHILVQNIDDAETARFPMILEQFYSQEIQDLLGKPVLIARQLLNNPILTCNDFNSCSYYRFIRGTFFFICREFLQMFGHSKHVVFRQLKETFNNWKYNVSTQKVMSTSCARRNIFNLIDALKGINHSPNLNLSSDELTQLRIQLQLNCLYCLSCMTVNYKNVELLTDEEEINMKVDMEIFHLNIYGPFDYTPVDVYVHLYHAETLYRYEMSRFRHIKFNDWIQEKPDECPVCYEEISCEEHLSCGHYVHRSCVIKTKKTCCPMCKSEIALDATELKQIFFKY